ncbi:MDIS1-interacting receptor like kinase 2-like isoform X2 [Prosopis cineraria]|uniref:MDIS1-interacting receptor like kinase 2-like isoform X2 n=1 Tax=Prosopis cineraria TaxID=364024 RepID=UPI00240F05F4|nr:MDIS1-interacting receptor like kinase 2-like isoform X2 [Prosopis cineraria]
MPSALTINVTHLQQLDLSGNKFGGAIPSSLGFITTLRYLNLSSNMFIGEIPSSISNLERLDILDFSHNQFIGLIPQDIGKLTSSEALNLTNNLSGLISVIKGITYLRSFNISKNNIYGIIPREIGDLLYLENLDLSQNKLVASLPNLQSLKLLVANFSHNMISGEIPPSFCTYQHMSRIDLSYNNITGNIPKELGQLEFINLSYNSLNGHVLKEVYYKFPHDILNGNKELLLGLEKNHYFSNHINIHYHMKIILPMTIFLVILFTFGFFLFRSLEKNKITKVEIRAPNNGDLFSIWNFDGKIAYEDIIEATEDFDIRYCIGIGAYGSVYRAQLCSGKIVALKKLHKKEYENPSFARSFHNEVKLMTKIDIVTL